MDELDFDRATAEAWREFAEKLAEVMSMMDETGALTIGAMTVSLDDQAPFVRISVTPAGEMMVAAASNAVLGEAFQLSAEQLELFDSMGWQPPTSVGDFPSDCFIQRGTTDQVSALAYAIVRVFREVYGVAHPVFLNADQLAEILVPQAPKDILPSFSTPVGDQETSVFWPQSVADLTEEVRRLLIERVGYEPLADSNGDRAIRVGSTAVIVRVLPDASEVLIYAPLVHEVDGRSRAVELLNDVNCEAKIGRYFLLKDRVYGSVSVFAQPLVAAHFNTALQAMSTIADAIDDELAAKLRGRTTFDESARAD